VPILDNSIANLDRTLLLGLSNVTGTASIDPQASNAVLTITDDDPRPGDLSFGASTFIASEADGFATITVLRTNGWSGAVSVSFSTESGTAQPAVDYEPVIGANVDFADGETFKTIKVPLVTDGVVDGNKSVQLRLTSPTGNAVLISPALAVLLITDVDFGPGSLDLTFAPGTGANGLVRSVAVYPDRRVLVGGAFTLFNQTDRNYVARLLADGSVDPTFAQGTYLA